MSLYVSVYYATVHGVLLYSKQAIQLQFIHLPLTLDYKCDIILWESVCDVCCQDSGYCTVLIIGQSTLSSSALFSAAGQGPGRLVLFG